MDLDAKAVEKMEYLQGRANDLADALHALLEGEFEGYPDVEILEPFERAFEYYDAGAEVTVKIDGQPLGGARVEIPSSDAMGGEMEGWGFGFGSTLKGGKTGPGGIMYNFTPRIWTRDDEEIERRLEHLSNNLLPFAQHFANEVKKEIRE